jgi:hypothetical protein
MKVSWALRRRCRLPATGSPVCRPACGRAYLSRPSTTARLSEPTFIPCAYGGVPYGWEPRYGAASFHGSIHSFMTLKTLWSRRQILGASPKRSLFSRGAKKHLTRRRHVKDLFPPARRSLRCLAHRPEESRGGDNRFAPRRSCEDCNLPSRTNPPSRPAWCCSAAT